MKRIDSQRIFMKLPFSVSTIEVNPIELEFEKDLKNLDVPEVDLEMVLKMLPESDNEHYVGNEYFVG